MRGGVYCFTRDYMIYIAKIDMDLLREYRENEVMGDRYRHPDKYGILTGGK